MSVKKEYSGLNIKLLRWGIAAILVIAPFYIALAVWIATGIHHLDFIKIWKEVALSLMAVILTTFLIANRSFARRVVRNPIFVAIGIYILLLIAIGFYDLASGRVGNKAIIYGWLTDLRPVAVFTLAALTFAISRQKNFPAFPWRKLILVPALVVIVFGFLQMIALPHDVLRHIGYSKTTTAPYETVDNQPNLVRVQSTLRGPNPFGAYILVITTIVVATIIADKSRKRWLWVGFALLALIVLYGTYSRSAEVGLVLSLLSLLVIEKGRLFSRYTLILLGGLTVVIGIGLLAATKHNYLAQNLLFHSSNKSTSQVSSNSQRTQAMKTAVGDIAHHPLGAGIGSAGPASGRNTKGSLRIAENYYLQIGQEAGVIGMLLFLAINALIAVDLWRQRNEQLAKILLASLIGLSFINLVSHAWTDDTLAYIWWGLAGLALAPKLMKAKNT